MNRNRQLIGIAWFNVAMFIVGSCFGYVIRIEPWCRPAVISHTPGPWVHEPGLVEEMGHTVWDRGGSMVCVCGHGDTEETNARLISAAPDLLKACTAFLDADINAEAIGRAAIAKCSAETGEEE